MKRVSIRSTIIDARLTESKVCLPKGKRGVSNDINSLLAARTVPKKQRGQRGPRIADFATKFPSACGLLPRYDQHDRVRDYRNGPSADYH